jgi:hypothetical protein
LKPPWQRLAASSPAGKVNVPGTDTHDLSRHHAVGTQQLLVLMLVTTVLFIDPREALMPFMADALKVLETRRVRLGGAAVLCVAALLLGLAVAIPVTLYIKLAFVLICSFWPDTQLGSRAETPPQVRRPTAA